MSYSANDNQNYFVASGRTTSRVIAQPGGQCSISLGGWTPEELERQRLLREQQQKGSTEKEEAEIAVEEEHTIAPVGKEINETKKETDQTTVKPVAAVPVKPQGVSSNAFASSSSTNSFNVITDRPTSRVLRPPGGHCSIVLG